MDVSALLAALGLAFIIEGLGPFLAPAWMRRLYLSMAQSPDKQLRVVGMLSIMAGLALLLFAPR